jgi:polar amino acid transport system permease protein
MRPLNVDDFVYLFVGLKWTIGLSLLALVLGGGIAAILVGISLFRSRLLDALVFGYVSLFQGTPLLGQLLFFYFGFSILGFDLPPFVAATVALSIYGAAFLSEIWRGAIDAIQQHQWEASESLGLGPLATLVYVILPQAMRIATPPTVGFMVQLIKDSSLASVLGFVELTRAAQLVNNATFGSFAVFGTIAVLYFSLCFPLTVMARSLERRLAF